MTIKPLTPRKAPPLARQLFFGEPGDPRRWVQCANAIVERIRDGRYPAGEWLPELAKLCAELGNNTYPVKRALEEVHEQRLITRVAGTGYYAGTGPQPPIPDNPHPMHPPVKSVRPRDTSDPAAARTAFLARQEYITVAEFAASLRVHNMTAYRLVNEGELPGSIRVGRSIRIPLSSAEAYLEGSLIIPGQLDMQDIADLDEDER